MRKYLWCLCIVFSLSLVSGVVIAAEQEDPFAVYMEMKGLTNKQEEADKKIDYQWPGVNLEQAVHLDGVKYTRAEIIAGFMRAAFSDTMWNEETGEDYKHFFRRQLSYFQTDKNSPLYKKFEKYRISLEARYPWLYPYIARKDGLPDFGRLNKWERRAVSIGIDWPLWGSAERREVSPGVYTKVRDVHEWSDYWIMPPEADYAILIDLINEITPDIEAATGLEIKFHLPGDQAERTSDFAKIRVVPKKKLTLKNFFRTYKDHVNNHREIISDFVDDRSVEVYSPLGGVSFSPYQRAQVDGYFYPERSGAIGLSVCKLFPAVGKDMLRALVTECLIRSLGLPGIVPGRKEALLGDWNSEYNDFSKTVALDGLEAFIGKLPANERIAKEEDFPKVSKDMKAFKRLSDYDKFNLRLLYCSDLKAGMDRYEVMRVLSTAEQCWAF